VLDFDSWNKVKKSTSKNRSSLIIREGEIRWCKIGLNIGNETYGKGESFSRPILVIKKFSRDVFWGIPITQRKKEGSWYFYLKNISRTAILNQMRLFDRKRLDDVLFHISENQVEEIKSKIISLIKS
jgi:mRNA interferase MazF